jgi:hypothetical protein
MRRSDISQANRPARAGKGPARQLAAIIHAPRRYFASEPGASRRLTWANL